MQQAVLSTPHELLALTQYGQGCNEGGLGWVAWRAHALWSFTRRCAVVVREGVGGQLQAWSVFATAQGVVMLARPLKVQAGFVTRRHHTLNRPGGTNNAVLSVEPG